MASIQDLIRALNYRNDQAVCKFFEDLLADLNMLRDGYEDVRPLVNELRADHNGAMQKLDNDAGVADANYNTTRNVAAPAVNVMGVLKTTKT